MALGYDQRRQVLGWFPPLPSQDRHQALSEARVGGVGGWLLSTEAFSTWHTSYDQAAKPVLLCYGDPGVGKTFISSLVVDTLGGENNDQDVVIYIYCDFRTQNAQPVSTVLGSLLHQAFGRISYHTGNFLDVHSRTGKELEGYKLPPSDILAILIRSLRQLSSRRPFICIDALDEFPTKKRAHLWDSLRRIVREAPTTRLFLTGRPQIREEVEKYFPGDANMVSINPAMDDITSYIEHRLEEDMAPDGVDEELRADILRIIPETLSGVFLLVALKMDAILGEVTIHKRRQAVSRITNGLDLRYAYEQTLDRIRQLGGSKWKLGVRALMWISRCERPLKPEELCYALGVELGEEEFNTQNVPSIRTILDCTLGFVTIDETASTVRLLHPTLREYLGQHPTLFVTAHPMMAKTCLTYLNCRSIRALPPSPDTALTTTPFLEYATCFWGTHATMEVTEKVKSLALRLLDGYENHVSASILWQKKIHKPGLADHVQGISGLHCIAFWGIVEIAIALLEVKRWDIDCRDSEGDAPLAWAVKYGNDRLAKLLLGRGGVSPDPPDHNGQTPQSSAARSGREDQIKPLPERGDTDPSSLGDKSQPPSPPSTEHQYCGSPEASDPATAATPGQGTPGRETRDTPPAPEGVTSRTTDDLSPDLSNSHPAIPGPPLEQPLPSKQSPPDQLDPASAPSTPTPILNSSFALDLLLLVLILQLIFACKRILTDYFT